MSPRFLYPLFFLVLFYNNGSDAYTDAQKKAIRAKLDPSAFSCAQETGVTRKQVEAAEKKRNINQFTACFFTCFLKKNLLLIAGPKGIDVLNVPALLVFVKTYIPTIGFLNVGPIVLELGRCAAEFTADPRVDTAPGCPKTKGLVNCLVSKSPNFIAAILKASRSDVTFTLNF